MTLQKEVMGPLKKERNVRSHTQKSSSSRTNNLSQDSNSQLEKFFHDQLKDLYWAEKHLTKALPKMRKPLQQKI
jgi:hypothetical protein